jgi:hypothetical protein
MYDQFAAAYALCIGVRLVNIIPGQWSRYLFDDTDGRASAALGQWRNGALIKGRDYANSLKQLKRMSRMTPEIAGTKGIADEHGTRIG